MEIFNGVSIALSDIPFFTASEFRSKIVTRCSSQARLLNFFGSPIDGGSIRLFAVLGIGQEPRLQIISTLISAEDPRYEALTKDLLAANMFEREIAEQWAIIPEGHPWLKPLRYHVNYRGVTDIWADIAKRPIPGMYPFYAMEGQEAHEVGVGPVHAGIIEPGHFRFQCHGEEVMHLEIQLGYQHRGIEEMLAGADIKRGLLLCESIAGDTSVGHATGFCEVVESLSGCVISWRAQAIRAVALELERLANHIGNLGALSRDAGFLPASEYFGRMRGDYLNLLLMLTGNRFGKGLCCPGGVLFDIDAKMAEDFCRKLKGYKKEFQDVSQLLFASHSVLERFEGIGVISSKSAKKLGLVGPVARASQLEHDARIDYPSGMWQFHHIPISLAVTGDVYARAIVRRQEVTRSLEFLLKILPVLPKGPIWSSVGSMKPGSLAISLVEGWRGEIMHVGITNEQGAFARYKVKDPSFNNWLGLAMAMRNQEISDFPLCNKSFDLSYCGHDL